MGKPTGFKEYPREVPSELPPARRVENYREFLLQLPVVKLKEQGARCMDCGLPFCHTGCPLGNIIPDFNDLVYRDDWEGAIRVLHATNNFPEFTGRVCPAPCEDACVLGITSPPVTIKNIELAIIERAFELGFVQPEPPTHRTGRKVAVIGSGPAGLAVAHQLNRAGHLVTIFERADRIGGLLRYGIPDFKLEKRIIDRRLDLMEAEGIVFRTGVDVGYDIDGEQLRREFDAIVLCGGATRPRDLFVPGRELTGVHFAMEFLPQQNKRVAGDSQAFTSRGWWFSRHQRDIIATDKHVIIIGGGDTGSDCVGTSNRQRARSVTQFELLPKPPEDRPGHQPWPYYPMKLRSSSSHKEGCERFWSLSTKHLNGKDGRVVSLETVQVEWVSNGSGHKMRELPGTEKTWPADLVLLAMGFVGPENDGIVTQLGCKLDDRGNIQADEYYQTSVPGVFACGDARRGQSLVVWAISEGREAARGVDLHLMGQTELPTKGRGDLPRS
ncbi:MAG TPA: glutamate synthase subunit beta [Phycisphaerae bacterium]|nr:glutamate synthase subunit beta [Phycisphaerae bacterium]